MSARILVVDDLEANRRLLQARLASDYYDVLLASAAKKPCKWRGAKNPI